MRFMTSAVVALTTVFALVPAGAQQPDCSPGRPLLSMPEIESKDGKLQGVVLLGDEKRSLSEDASGAGCESLDLRFFQGWSTQEPREEWPSTGDPIPGPTLRAKVGDLVQLTFLNQIDLSKFSNTLDLGEQGKTDGCDSARAPHPDDPEESVLIYPRIELDGPDAQGDEYPNCLHGSSTANIHFHGIHSTPSTTGDNVLLFIRPALRVGAELLPDDAFVEKQFAELFDRCAADGPPESWEQMPAGWQAEQKKLLETYDRTAPYKGEIGALPAALRLWPKNEARLSQGLWPQYSIGAYPHCFPLPDYDRGGVKMGQAPGTHWYHAHKHGSTALNVTNGMTGAFVIEGGYDDALREFYKETPEHENWGLEEQVLMIQQLQASLNLLSGNPDASAPPLSVNGRLRPVVRMKPNQVQLWRVINAAPRSFVQLYGFTGPEGQDLPEWRQTAQDGVQLAYENYERIGAPDARINLASGNRADLLVKAPDEEGVYELQIVESVRDIPTGDPKTLLTVRVEADDEPIDPPMDFIEAEADFPAQPEFLADITGPYYLRRGLYFNTVPGTVYGQGKGLPHHQIDGKLFEGHDVDQTMYLDTVEEWTVYNLTPNIAHPFHIHVNPFQVVEVFQPNDPAAANKNHRCYADPLRPETWKPCERLEPPYVWWDVFGIPTGREEDLPATVCTELDRCPVEIRQYTSCEDGECTVTIPGYFKMRSRFVDYTGQFVIHCHILGHEDRGMMQLVEVVPTKSKTPYEHH